jgi:hypothetical protein
MKSIVVRVEKTVFAEIEVLVHDEKDAIPTAIQVAIDGFRPIDWQQTDGHNAEIIRRNDT